MLWALYFSQDTSWPVAFELIKKTQLVTHPKTAQDKWISPTTKNELARAMMAATVARQLPFQYVLMYVLMEVWFSSAQNMVFIKLKVKKDFILPLQGNRRLALCEQHKKRGPWTSLESLESLVGSQAEVEGFGEVG